MKINLNKTDFKKFNDLIAKDDANRWISDFYDDMTIHSKEIARKAESIGNLFVALIPYYELDDTFFENAKPFHVKDNLNELDPEEYENNPYVLNVQSKSIKEDGYELKYEKFIPYQPFVYKDIDLINDYEITSLGYFKKEYSYLTLSYDKEIWMLLTPHEMNTMKKAIDKSHGNVITFGLGLGYFAFMASEKENVKSVTIIEKDDKIIDLFKKYILPSFNHPEKINIINADAIDILKQSDFDYDYAFVDLWHDTEDGLPLYIQIHQLAKNHAATSFDYWIEKSMLLILRRCLISLLYEEINKENIEYNEEENYYDHIMNEFHRILINQKISSYEDIKELIQETSILKITDQIA